MTAYLSQVDTSPLSNSTTENHQNDNLWKPPGLGSQRSSLVDDLPLLNGLYIGILASMAVNAVLFYLQWWKPAQEEEKEMENEVEQETAMTDSDQQRIEEGKYSIIPLL